jgi:acetyl esterase/lipase
MEYSNSLMLDFYRAVGRSPAPCVVVIHGGSWLGGNRKDEGTKPQLNHWLARHGYAVASIDYRLAPEWIWPAQRDDLLAALAFLRAQAPALGIDPTRFVLLGRSAGGQMATATAFSRQEPGIRGIIAIYPPTDFRLTWESATHPGNLDHRLNLEMSLGGTPQTAIAAYDSASAALLVHPGVPPTLILQGGFGHQRFSHSGSTSGRQTGRCRSEARAGLATLGCAWVRSGQFRQPRGANHDVCRGLVPLGSKPMISDRGLLRMPKNR